MMASQATRVNSLAGGPSSPKLLSLSSGQKLSLYVALKAELRRRLIELEFQIAAGEAKNPRRNLPKAIKRVYVRILLFYIGGTFVIGLLVPSNDPQLDLGTGTAASSPFVIAIQNAGIKGLPSVSNGFYCQR